MKPRHIQSIVDGLLYDTRKANIIASDAYWDGFNWERKGRNTYLYCTSNSRYFVVKLTNRKDEVDQLMPLTKWQALELFSQLAQCPSKDNLPFEQAFPDVKIEEA